MISFEDFTKEFKAKYPLYIVNHDDSLSSVYANHIKILSNDYLRLFSFSGVPLYCGAIHLSGIKINSNHAISIAESKKELIEILHYTLIKLKDGHYGIVNYITEENQHNVIEVLEHFNFKKDRVVVNPNSGNTCYFWSLDLVDFNE